MTETGPWRRPSAWERDLIKRLAGSDRAGYDVYRAQADRLDVREVGWERQLELRVPGDAPIVTDPDARKTFFIGEAEYIDDDGSHVSFMLHVADGKLRFLEILKTPVPAPVANREPPLSTLRYRDPVATRGE